MVDFAGDVAFEASEGFAFGFSFGLSAGGVGLGAWVVLEPVDGDGVEGSVGLAVAASVEAVSLGVA